eukprot:gene5773-6211_t
MTQFTNGHVGACMLQPYPQLYVVQLKKISLCCCSCCYLDEFLNPSLRTPFKVGPLDKNAVTLAQYHADTNNFSVVEESDRWGAFCERLHPFKLTMTFGKDRQPVAHYERPFRCFVANCKCCCFQEIDVFDGVSLRSLGSVRESCWICMPQFRIYDAENKELYHITTPHCYCCGILPKHCTDCCCGGTFDIIPTRSEKNSAQGQMIRSYDDLLHIYKCSFSNESNGNDKALILGASYLINELFFDKRFFPPSIGD